MTERQSGILIIEDEEIIQEVFSAHLTLAGYVVFGASDGEQGLILCREHASQIDLIILDLQLPGQSGYQILPSLRAISPQAKVVICTADLMNKSEFEDVQAVLKKPVPSATLLKTVKTVLGDE